MEILSDTIHSCCHKSQKWAIYKQRISVQNSTLCVQYIPTLYAKFPLNTSIHEAK
jgi:hypothetical protein